MDDLDTPGKRLKWARTERGKFDTATEAAKAHGWPISTYLGHENGDRVPGRSAAIKYGRTFKVPWDWILEGGPLPDGKRNAPAGPIPTKGEVAAGLWLDIDLHADTRHFDQHPITADPRYPREAQYGLIVRGTSINRIAADGDVLHCLDLMLAREDTAEDDIVIVERMRAQASQKEVTAKRIRKRGDIIVLAPDSTDSKWKPIEFDPGDGQDSEDEVRVIALVLAVYKPLRRRR